MTVNVEFIGLLEKQAGIAAESFNLNEGSSLRELLAKVFTRHPAIDREERYFVAVNKKIVKDYTVDQSKLANGDLVTVGVRVIGG